MDNVDKNCNRQVLGSLMLNPFFLSESDKYNLSKTLYIKTDQNFSNIHYVTVLKEKA